MYVVQTRHCDVPHVDVSSNGFWSLDCVSAPALLSHVILTSAREYCMYTFESTKRLT